ncbi:hypothetical protein CEXT_539061 [Caerostris extrusa]|uniref:Uncharacterized protein n=1 Tax=Caerostris extrusa TaxID=172846 RepID=A0AAV4RDL8_CAEEX|nr:hypothetical protein CEXT_539061 [Caerostris extrusa]
MAHSFNCTSPTSISKRGALTNRMLVPKTRKIKINQNIKSPNKTVSTPLYKPNKSGVATERIFCRLLQGDCSAPCCGEYSGPLSRVPTVEPCCRTYVWFLLNAILHLLQRGCNKRCQKPFGLSRFCCSLSFSCTFVFVVQSANSSSTTETLGFCWQRLIQFLYFSSSDN